MFTPIDFNTWPRRELFYYFSKMAPTGYSLTVNMDVTKLRRTVKAAGVKFFPAYLWLVTRCLNEQPEFKCAVKDGQLGYYDTLTPLYATMHPETHTISLMWTEYCESFPEFHRRYVENQEKYGSHHGVLSPLGGFQPLFRPQLREEGLFLSQRGSGENDGNPRKVGNAPVPDLSPRHHRRLARPSFFGVPAKEYGEF